jgi:hypothetical protein
VAEEILNRRCKRAFVRVNNIKVSSNAQREFRRHKAATIAANLDPDKIGVPVLSLRDGHYWVIDGQHRVAALKIIGYGETKIECDVYRDLTEREEAELFDGLNDALKVSTLDKFLVRVTAHRERECAIEAAVRNQGYTVGSGKGRIGAVSALGKVYDMAGQDRLEVALRIIRDSYGDSGMRAEIIEGVGLVTHRYNGQLSEERAVEKLSALNGGMSGLISKSEVIRRTVGRPKAHCVAAAVVETINSGRGGKKLPDWWQ